MDGSIAIEVQPCPGVDRHEIPDEVDRVQAEIARQVSGDVYQEMAHAAQFKMIKWNIQQCGDSAVAWALAHADEYKYRHLYFGITESIIWRTIYFGKPPHCRSWGSIHAVWHGPGTEAGRVERSLISAFSGDDRLQNVKPGGEQAKADSHMYVYMCGNTLDEVVSFYNVAGRRRQAALARRR